MDEDWRRSRTMERASSCLWRTLAVSLDHARLPVMMLRHFDGNMRRDGSSAARPQPSQPVAERGELPGAPELSAGVAERTAANRTRTLRVTEERRRWRRRPDLSHRLGRQDKAGHPAAGAWRLSVCLHVAFGVSQGRYSNGASGALSDFAFDFNGPPAVSRGLNRYCFA